ncbi:molybdenum cofactor guanylyltransferase MobA [Pseudomonas sp. JS3066]|jgi:molybdopterin-guanine dinucleotide biosynthesis protein A|uniref:molybdenum cofactor guanylyltransferase MobA n=1 Tax=unclassified Pseudomonas TaxID=196821 RepID=UPI000EA8CA7B|nr:MULTISPECIES: molybdenum cofactor guanylyltransferase MobA [unclassified Pseudomonas]AYF87352.1 molybdenum cofactor guanylyltransferase MobA [Pseudomonas sp. DY-1]WVK95106.1 molybdenum cofactor guanylyltransferase MobA [Pseudomonas sp. JS3066]
MTDQPLPHCSVLLLSGGRGQRLGGRDKGLVEWCGRPLIAWLHERVRPLTDDLIISCNRNAEQYAAWADQLVQDDSPDYPGPLAGIRAGLAVAHHDQVLILPCDAPQVDDTLIASLLAAACERPVMVRQGELWEPLFCVLPRRVLPILEAGWQAGERSPQRILRQLDPVAVVCPEGDPRLANLNTPDLLGPSCPGN